MNIKDLKVGDKVFIREDLEHGAWYGGYMYINAMNSGVKQIQYTYGDEGFSVVCGKGARYTSEMVDWDKTMNLKDIQAKDIQAKDIQAKDIQAKEYLNKKFGDNTAHNPSHYGGGGIHNIECYKAIEYILDKLENVPERYYGHVSNIVKYIWRCNNKNGYEDLDKASVYLDFMFREEE